MIKHTLTQEDLDNNPDLHEKCKVGDVIEIQTDAIIKSEDSGGDRPPKKPPTP